jgi:hypothetical protein
MDERIDDLTARVSHLERTNRVMKVVYALGIAVAFASSQLPNLSAAGAPKSITAQKFNLVDAAGLTLATLGGDANGGNLTLYDFSGQRILAAGVNEDQSGYGLRVYDGTALAPGSGIARASFGWGGGSSTTPGYGALVRDPEGTRRASFGSLLDGSGQGTASYGSNGTLRTFNGVGSDPRFVGSYVFDANGFVRTGINTDAASNFSGAFSNGPNGTNRAFFGERLDGSASFMGLLDSNGVRRVLASQSGVAAGVEVRDSDDNFVASLP